MIAVAILGNRKQYNNLRYRRSLFPFEKSRIYIMAWNSRSMILKRLVYKTFQNHGVAALIAMMLILLTPKSILWCSLYIGGILFLTSVIVPFVNDWRRKPRVSTKGKAVFITGCDSGFGYILAQRLDDMGLVVFAGCLFPGKEGAVTLKKSCSSKLYVVPLDVTLDDSVEAAVKYVMDNIGDNKLWCVVNNAGVNAGGEIAWTNMNRIEYVMNVNTLGVVRTTKAFLPMLCKDKGRVVTVASAGGRHLAPGCLPYCMSKHATINFCEGLRIEMLRFGIKFITIEPTFYNTPLTNEDYTARYLSIAWNESPDNIKELYPKNYIDGYIQNVQQFIKRCSQRNPHEVIDCLEEAVLAVDPKYVYKAGWLILRFALRILSMLPKEIQEATLYLFMYA